MEVQAAHWLKNHPGKCRYLHGHSYKIEVKYTAPGIEVDEQSGMLIDFGELKAIMTETVMPLDHALLTPYSTDEITSLINAGPELLSAFGIFEITRLIPLGMETTAENIAGHLAQTIRAKLRMLNYHLGEVEVAVWETSNSCVTAQVNL